MPIAFNAIENTQEIKNKVRAIILNQLDQRGVSLKLEPRPRSLRWRDEVAGRPSSLAIREKLPKLGLASVYTNCPPQFKIKRTEIYL